MRGEQFPQRVGASLLSAVGANQELLAVDSLRDFEDLAVSLAGTRRLRALRARLPATARAAYTDAVAWRHYRLAFVDYARHLFCHMVTDASAAAFDAKNASARAANIGLLYRDPRVALRLVAKLGEYLSVLEAERREDDTCEAAEVEASGT